MYTACFGQANGEVLVQRCATVQVSKRGREKGLLFPLISFPRAFRGSAKQIRHGQVPSKYPINQGTRQRLLPYLIPLSKERITRMFQFPRELYMLLTRKEE